MLGRVDTIGHAGIVSFGGSENCVNTFHVNVAFQDHWGIAIRHWREKGYFLDMA